MSPLEWRYRFHMVFLSRRMAAERYKLEHAASMAHEVDRNDKYTEEQDFKKNFSRGDLGEGRTRNRGCA